MLVQACPKLPADDKIRTTVAGHDVAIPTKIDSNVEVTLTGLDQINILALGVFVLESGLQVNCISGSTERRVLVLMDQSRIQNEMFAFGDLDYCKLSQIAINSSVGIFFTFFLRQRLSFSYYMNRIRCCRMVVIWWSANHYGLPNAIKHEFSWLKSRFWKVACLSHHMHSPCCETPMLKVA